jgi:UDP-galactopyranose mutase
MPSDFDLLIVGAGPVGCVVAEVAARELGWSVQMIDKRSHLAGNCYDSNHSSGVFIHNYGPHYFRTSNESLFTYLSRFTEWIPGNYFVKSFAKGQYFSFPINLNTLEQFYGRPLTPESAEELLAQVRIPNDSPKNSEEFVLSRVGRELYETFYLGYTQKQWSRHPRELDASVCGRIPIRFNRDERYVNEKHQVMPKEGYTRLFETMIDHPRISVRLKTDYRHARHEMKPKRATVYCGPIDEYFDHRLGRLPWRSLRFEWREYAERFKQPCVQINYPNDFDYTRSVEIKHVTGQDIPHTILSYEYAQDMGDPYYPVPSAEARKLFHEYQALAEQETAVHNVYFAGRLAQYVYMNMDQAMETGLATVERLKKDAFKHV